MIWGGGALLGLGLRHAAIIWAEGPVVNGLMLIKEVLRGMKFQILAHTALATVRTPHKTDTRVISPGG